MAAALQLYVKPFQDCELFNQVHLTHLNNILIVTGQCFNDSMGRLLWGYLQRFSGWNIDEPVRPLTSSEVLGLSLAIIDIFSLLPSWASRYAEDLINWVLDVENTLDTVFRASVWVDRKMLRLALATFLNQHVKHAYIEYHAVSCRNVGVHELFENMRAEFGLVSEPVHDRLSRFRDYDNAKP
jgi:hypothetical protein